MKKNMLFLLPALLLVFVVSCKKSDNNGNDTEVETTLELSENQAVADHLSEDAFQVFIGAAVSEGLMGRTSEQQSCGTITVTPASGFPKTVTIDFGASCTTNGITRSGKIIVVVSDSLRLPGTTATMSFENYFVQNFKLEGTITWTNTSTQNGLGWQRVITDGKVTAPGGSYYWLHVGTKTVTQIAGAGTPFNPLDDVYSATGDHTVTNPQSESRTATVTEALEKMNSCAWVSKGKIKVQGPNHYAILDYGTGSCDNNATISIDGQNPIDIQLP